ncbi:MAG: hypothetical protein D6706_13060 [Chloroflexi bacterium]|nr:MAG: hypothetical protein D6706_13060 [Chloroflexota bacterium]
MDLLETAVHLLAYLETRLDADLGTGLAAWQHAFNQARVGWQLGSSRWWLAVIPVHTTQIRQRR